MNILRLLRDESPSTLAYIAVMSGLSGLAGGGLLALIVKAAEIQGADGSASDDDKHRLLAFFLLALALLAVTKRVSVLRSTALMETVLMDLRNRICDKIRRTELATIEVLDRNEILTALSRDTGVLSQIVYVLSITCQQAVLLIVSMLYLAWLSRTAFFLFILVGAAAGYVYYLHSVELGKTATRDREKQSQLVRYLNYILFGFKELRLSALKSDQLYGDMTDVSREAKDLAIESNEIYVRSALISDFAFYMLLGTIVFILPNFSETYSDVLVKSTMAVMFAMGPLSTVVGIVPQVSNANVALARLYELERNVDATLDDATATSGASAEQFSDFRRIHCLNMEFSYLDSEGSPLFTVGPLDLEINRAEILFIVGGNGSGKSTLLKLLTGLYRPQSGSLRVDQTVVTQGNRHAYRELIAGVFSDFFLFDRLYGVGPIDEDRARQLLAMMEMSEKVRIVDGRFSTLDLSTGQRKRLALVAALLEDREIYVFDEWTADQDPHFRQQFYGTILPELKSQGKTVIAVTHDDRYWDSADRVLSLDYGQLVDRQ